MISENTVSTASLFEIGISISRILLSVWRDHKVIIKKTHDQKFSERYLSSVRTHTKCGSHRTCVFVVSVMLFSLSKSLHTIVRLHLTQYDHVSMVESSAHFDTIDRGERVTKMCTRESPCAYVKRCSKIDRLHRLLLHFNSRSKQKSRRNCSSVQSVGMR